MERRNAEEENLLLNANIIVVSTQHELEELKKNKFIYFAKHSLAKGVLEGIEHHIKSLDFEAAY